MIEKYKPTLLLDDSLVVESSRQMLARVCPQRHTDARSPASSQSWRPGYRYRTLGGGSWKESLTLTVLLFVVLIPFFVFTELRRVIGEDRLIGAFFRANRFLPFQFVIVTESA